MVAWREGFSRDVIDEREFYTQKQAEREAAKQARRAARRMKRERRAVIEAQLELNRHNTLDDNEPRWEDLFCSTMSSSSDSDFDFDFED
jgi:hypothetical protein